MLIAERVFAYWELATRRTAYVCESIEMLVILADIGKISRPEQVPEYHGIQAFELEIGVARISLYNMLPDLGTVCFPAILFDGSFEVLVVRVSLKPSFGMRPEELDL